MEHILEEGIALVSALIGVGAAFLLTRWIQGKGLGFGAFLQKLIPRQLKLWEKLSLVLKKQKKKGDGDP